jgi:sugar phosphate permease
MPTSGSPESNGIPAALLVVIVLLAISVFISYVDRGNLSIPAPLLKGELHISASQLGTLLSAFFWTNKILALNFSEEHRGFANSVLSTGLLLGPGAGILC